MSEWPNNGCPPRPQGVGDNGVPGVPGKGLVPFGRPSGEGRPALSASSGLVFCALGGLAAASSLSIAAPALLGFGFVAASSVDRRTKVLAAALAGAFALAFSVPSGIAAVAVALIVCLASLAAAQVISVGRMTPGTACVIVAALAALHLGADAAAAALSGTSLPAVVGGMLDAIQQQLSAASLDVSMQMREVRALFGVLWPTTYTVVALGEFLFAGAGARLAASRLGEKVSAPAQMSAFDLPLWVVVALVVGAAGLAAALTLSEAASGALLMVTANLVMSLRFAFAAQGLAVLSWLVREKHVNPLVAGLLGVAALYLEMQYFVMTVVGLVDVWVNFRHLARGQKPTDAGDAKQD